MYRPLSGMSSKPTTDTPWVSLAYARGWQHSPRCRPVVDRHQAGRRPPVQECRHALTARTRRHPAVPVRLPSSPDQVSFRKTCLDKGVLWPRLTVAAAPDTNPLRWWPGTLGGARAVGPRDGCRRSRSPGEGREAGSRGRARQARGLARWRRRDEGGAAVTCPTPLCAASPTCQAACQTRSPKRRRTPPCPTRQHH